MKTKKAMAALLGAVVAVSGFAGAESVKAYPLPSDVDSIPGYAKETIKKLYAQNKISGFEDGTFQPLTSLSRAEFVAMILRAYPYEKSKYDEERISEGEIIFKDAGSMTAWQKQIMIDGYLTDIVSGTETEYIGGITYVTLDANKKITREEMAAILVKAKDLMVGTNTLNSQQRDDVLKKYWEDKNKVSSWAKTAVATAINEKLLSGTSESAISPKAIATRVDAALLMDRLELVPTTIPDKLYFNKSYNLGQMEEEMEKMLNFTRVTYLNPLGNLNLSQVKTINQSDFRYIKGEGTNAVGRSYIVALNKDGKEEIISSDVYHADSFYGKRTGVYYDEDSKRTSVVLAFGEDTTDIYNELVNTYKFTHIKIFDYSLSETVGLWLDEEEMKIPLIGNEWVAILDSYGNFVKSTNIFAKN